MTSYINCGLNKASNAISYTYNTVVRALNEQPPFYAKKEWIEGQRITAVALIALGASGVGPVTWPIQVPLITAGCTLIGLSLLQQVLGQSPGCGRAKISRIAAGLLFLSATPISCLVGSLFWSFSNDANTPRCRHGL